MTRTLSCICCLAFVALSVFAELPAMLRADGLAHPADIQQSEVVPERETPKISTVAIPPIFDGMNSQQMPDLSGHCTTASIESSAAPRSRLPRWIRQLGTRPTFQHRPAQILYCNWLA